MADDKFKIIITRIGPSYPKRPHEEHLPFLATIQEIKEFLKIGPFQNKFDSPEFCNFYDTMHSRAADLYIAALKNGKTGLSDEEIETLDEDNRKLYAYLIQLPAHSLPETYNIFHNPIVEKIAEAYPDDLKHKRPTNFDVAIIDTRDWIKGCPSLKFLKDNNQETVSRSLLTPNTKDDPRFCYAATLYLNKDGVPHRLNGPAVILEDGTEQWWDMGCIHREDGPAIIKPDGTEIWVKRGGFNRKDGPAVKLPDGREFWFKAGVLGCEDGPAISCPNGLKLWYKCGVLEQQSYDITEKDLDDILYEYTDMMGTEPLLSSTTRPDGSVYRFKNGLMHNDDGPAVELTNGNNFWYKNGIAHNDDGPAVTDLLGSETWYKDGICRGNPSGLNSKKMIDEGNNLERFSAYTNNIGQRHRVNGPASIFSSGGEMWYLGGKKHRDDGPAITDIEGTLIWFRNGEKHREDGPASVSAAGQEEWWINNQLHRLDGPAIICANGDEHWYKNGKKHNDDGPAVCSEQIGKSWMKDGLLHRLDGPAIIKSDGSQYWYVNNVIHRVDGPAVILKEGSEQWLQNGKFHREGGPSIINAHEIIEAWYIDGQLHREDGPAITLEDGTREWWINGEPHRLDGPAIEFSTGDGYWYKNGIKHRDEDLPAISVELGSKQCWIKNGQLHRDSGPAVIFSNGHKEWWINGKKHREDGPAIIHQNGKQSWWINGEIQKPEDIRQRMKLVTESSIIEEDNIIFKEENQESEGEKISAFETLSDNIIKFPTQR